MNSAFNILYDLRDPESWKRAHCHRNLWGKLYTDIHVIDNDHILLYFCPAPDERWRKWEEVRRRWILEEVA